MNLEADATYDHGTLRLDSALPLQDGQRVKVTIQTTGSAVDRLYGMLRWTGSREDLEHLLGPDNRSGAREE